VMQPKRQTGLVGSLKQETLAIYFLSKTKQNLKLSTKGKLLERNILTA
jgi:hypothetical protein